MFSVSLFKFPDLENIKQILVLFILIGASTIVEWLGRNNEYAIEKIPLKMKRLPRWAFYYGMVFMIFYFAGKQQQFIYFQF